MQASRLHCIGVTIKCYKTCSRIKPDDSSLSNTDNSVEKSESLFDYSIQLCVYNILHFSLCQIKFFSSFFEALKS